MDYKRLDNWHHIDPDLLAGIRRYFGDNIAGVPMWGTTGLPTTAIWCCERMPDAPLDSAAMLFDPAVVSRFADCGVSLLDDPTSVIPDLRCCTWAIPPILSSPLTWPRWRHYSRPVRPYIKYFSSTKLLLDLPSREVCVAMAWSGDYTVAITRAAEAGVDIGLGYTIPLEARSTGTT